MRLTRREAAELLGCSPQTITNLAERGALSVETIGKWRYFNRKEVLSLIPKTDGLRNAEKAIAEAEAELWRERSERITDTMMYKARRDFIQQMCDTATFHRYTELVAGVYEAIEASALLGEKLSKEERATLDLIVHLRPLDEIAYENHITPDAARRIFGRAIRKMIQFSRDIGTNVKALRAELEEEKKQRRTLEEELRSWRTAKPLSPVTGKPTQRLLDIPVKDIDGFSVRLVNGLHKAEIFTVRDLIRRRRPELKRIQNIGSRCMGELDRFFDRYGLSYGTTSDD